jgi:hypothetical protein
VTRSVGENLQRPIVDFADTPNSIGDSNNAVVAQNIRVMEGRADAIVIPPEDDRERSWDWLLPDWMSHLGHGHR